MNETKAGGPFKEIVDHDVFVNCIYLTTPIPPFVTRDMLQNCRLSVVSDVSCDCTNPHNPLPYYGSTTFIDPVIRVGDVDFVAIDHLPTMVPREASEMFARDLLPSLKALRGFEAQEAGGEGVEGVWHRAHALYLEKKALLQ
jgi:saccharopine dehydrogenase (NAD+, L-lysine-forming)